MSAGVLDIIYLYKKWYIKYKQKVKDIKNENFTDCTHWILQGFHIKYEKVSLLTVYVGMNGNTCSISGEL